MSIVHKNENIHSFAQSTVVSKDGTKIGFQSIGQGPGLIVIHGALSTSDEFTRLAHELSDSFTVHIMDRRGRGRSGPQGAAYSINKECEDVKAIREATGAANIFGHSFGGLVTLEFARANSTLKKIAVYEPGVSIQSKPKEWDWLIQYEEALRQKDSRGAFTSFVRGAGHSPLTRLPYWYAKFILRMVVRGERWKQIERLLLTCLNEHKEVKRLESTHSKYDTIDANVLLMAGEKSPETIHYMIRVLEKTILDSQVKVYPKLDHLAPENQHSPQVLALSLKKFLLD